MNAQNLLQSAALPLASRGRRLAAELCSFVLLQIMALIAVSFLILGAFNEWMPPDSEYLAEIFVWISLFIPLGYVLLNILLFRRRHQSFSQLLTGVMLVKNGQALTINEYITRKLIDFACFYLIVPFIVNSGLILFAHQPLTIVDRLCKTQMVKVSK